MIFQSTARGSSTPLEMMGTGNVKILSLGEEEIQALEDYGLMRGVIPAGTYTGQDEILIQHMILYFYSQTKIHLMM